jgi:hypothetical protein
LDRSGTARWAPQSGTTPSTSTMTTLPTSDGRRASLSLFQMTGKAASMRFGYGLPRRRTTSRFLFYPPGKATNPIAVLFPTLSYLAYANECVDPVETAPLNPLYDLTLRREELSYAEANGLKSTYDSHIDRSGICFSAVRRPTLTFGRARVLGSWRPRGNFRRTCILWTGSSRWVSILMRSVILI